MQIIKPFILMLLLVSGLVAQECKVDDKIMYGIAMVERHKKTPVGYPFLISLNSKKDQHTVSKIKSLKKYFLDRRTLDCKNQKTCTAMLSALNEIGIKNLDLGAYQINEMFWKMESNDYFDIKKSYSKACDIVMMHNKDGWSWKHIANYHSKTKSHNEQYKRQLIASIERISLNEQ